MEHSEVINLLSFIKVRLPGSMKNSTLLDRFVVSS